jgi:hypothetical protein
MEGAFLSVLATSESTIGLCKRRLHRRVMYCYFGDKCLICGEGPN